MNNSVFLIKNIKKEEDVKKIKEFLSIYVNNGFSTESLLEVAKDFKESKRNLVLDYLVDTSILNLSKIAGSNYLKDTDKVYVIKKLIDNDKDILPLAYLIMNHVDDPKKYFTSHEINLILKDVDTKEIIESYGTYFASYLLDKPNYYYLLEIKKDLNSSVLNEVYIKSFCSKDDYLIVINYLNNEEKKDYVDKFLNYKEANYEIAYDILKNKYYKKEDHEKLLKIISGAKASIIYEILMEEPLNEKENKMLEKALLKTGDIEYIAYYYFFKNKEKFILLFGSSLLFLSFVALNKNTFKNKKLLNTITKIIKDEEAYFSEEVKTNVDIAYHKMQKNVSNSKK